jgi:putative transposase
MRTFRRFYVPEAIVFITSVTHKRIPYLAEQGDMALFWQTLRAVQVIHPFHLLAHVTLPDHFHWLMRVDDESGDFSSVVHSAKRNYTWNYKRAHGIQGPFHLWQDRFWDHVIRDEKDLQRHFDYIHFNPVKHGYVQHPEDWPHSSYRHWLRLGYYEPGWGSIEPEDLEGMAHE